MAKVKLYDENNGTYMIKCPAGHHHYINTKVPNHKQAQWSFNGNLDKPTFTPSINERAGQYVPEITEEQKKFYIEMNSGYICHFIVTDGNIYFCGDCTHELKNQTLPLLDIE